MYWFSKASEHKGDSSTYYLEAIYYLGLCYLNGRGVEKDAEVAVSYFAQAAECWVREAQYELGNCYQHGFGIAQDKQLAREWYGKAAEQGHEKAKYALQEL